MSIQPAALFTPRWEIFWGTTYSFELELFDEYLFRRLGDPPLNATVLVDFATLAGTWDAIRPGEEWRVQRVNRLYLVRAAGKSQGRFHPKTYFFANGKEGALLVGSGNLSLSGLEEGREIFSRFDSSTEEGLAAILGWRDWMKDIVHQTGDELLGQRWFRLRQSTREWLKGRSGSAAFVTNVESSLLDQLLEKLSNADEVHVTAPFFDRNVEALGSLIKRSQARSVSVYLGKGTSVDGAALGKLLKGTQAKTSVFVFEPPTSVHAKLVAVIKGNRARLLSGSANLSRAAFTATPTNEPWANTEAGVLSHVTAHTARELFRPPELEPIPITFDALTVFSFKGGDEASRLPLRLLSARPDNDGVIEVSFLGKPSSDLFLTSQSIKVALNGFRTAKMFPMGEKNVLVWLSGPEGQAVSNRVPLDDPAALRKQLEEPSGKASDRPRELDASDMESPVARILARLHSEFIFDLDELDSIRQAERANENDTPDKDASNFWELLAREELQSDPRAGAYRRFGGQLPLEGDEVFLLLRMMLDRTPERVHRSVGTDVLVGGDTEHGPGFKWTITQRLQVRLMNVLTRWARALDDPRMNWIQPFSSVRNFQALLYALAELWELEALPQPKLKLATGLIFGSFVRSDEADGYVFQISGDERKDAVARISPEARAVATVLAYLGLRPGSEWEDNIFEWQAWLRPCLEEGILGVTNEAAQLASRLLDAQVTVHALNDRLKWAQDFIDDPRWCLKMERVCGLRAVRFSRERFAFELVLEVEARHHLVDDPGVVRLIRNALDFRRADGIVIMSGPERVSVRLGERAAARLHNREVLETQEPVTESVLALLEEGGLPLRQRLAQFGAEAAVP
jgi:HKD family nuclease